MTRDDCIENECHVGKPMISIVTACSVRCSFADQITRSGQFGAEDQFLQSKEREIYPGPTATLLVKDLQF